MPDTKTWAMRIVANGELYLRRSSDTDPWEISAFHRILNLSTALMEGCLRCEQLSDHPILHQKFKSPEEAAKAVRQLLAA
jgi:hypothetical protein